MTHLAVLYLVSRDAAYQLQSPIIMMSVQTLYVSSGTWLTLMTAVKIFDMHTIQSIMTCKSDVHTQAI